MIRPNYARVDNTGVGNCEDRLRVARAEGPGPFNAFEEVCRKRLWSKQCINIEPTSINPISDLWPQETVETFYDFIKAAPWSAERSSHLVPAARGQQPGLFRCRDCPTYIDASHRSERCPRDIAVQCKNGGRQVELVLQASCHNADNARMPALGSYSDNSQALIRGSLLKGFLKHMGFDRLALLIEEIECACCLGREDRVIR